MSRQPFEIGDEVVFIEDPAPTPERVLDIKRIDDARTAHWRVTTRWVIGDREFCRIADAVEFRPAGEAGCHPRCTGDVGSDEVSPDTSRVAFAGALRWALVLRAEVCRANGGHVPAAAAEAIVAAAWNRVRWDDGRGDR
jgi:hypothetical protein